MLKIWSSEGLFIFLRRVLLAAPRKSNHSILTRVRIQMPHEEALASTLNCCVTLDTIPLVFALLSEQRQDAISLVVFKLCSMEPWGSKQELQG